MLTKKLWRALLAGLALFGLAGCSSISHKVQSGAVLGTHAARSIVIFLDGTANDEGSDTNVKRLHSLMTLQDRPDIASLYLPGVGIETDVVGAATGSGINKRAMIAYEFILNHYRHKAPGEPPDRIYIFGFSRGAYSARILTSLLYHAGVPLPADRSQCAMTSAQLAEAVHEAVAPVERNYVLIDETQRRILTHDMLKKFSLGSAGSNPGVTPRFKAKGCFYLPAELDTGKPQPSDPVHVEVLGLWDTVEALGLANWPSRILSNIGVSQHIEDIDVPNTRYGDKLCNVRYAFQAASIDDNRAWIFTPLQITRSHLFAGCQTGLHAPENPMLKNNKIIQGRLREVWFSGAHSDVGGGYGDSALSGTSLNWMIGVLKEASSEAGLPRLLPHGAKVREDIFGSSHNPSSGLFNLAYHSINRDLVRYTRAQEGDQNGPVSIFKGRLCIHRSVFERRKLVPKQWFENQQLQLEGPSKFVVLTEDFIEPTLRWKWFVEQKEGAEVIGRRAGAGGGEKPPALRVDAYPECANMSGDQP